MGDMADKVHPDIVWDAEAQEAAMAQAQQVSKRDPEAGALLIAQLIATQKAQQEKGEPITAAPSDYNPARLYAFMAREAGWEPRQIDNMHYLTFFAIVREVNERIQQENKATKGTH